ncbi:hypothetical protein WJX79_000108 [Trebouxia sp. C0005]
MAARVIQGQFKTAAISPATVTSGRAPSQQELLPLLLKLKKRCMPRSIKLLQITCAATQLPLQIWQEHRSKRMICSDRLVEIAQQLDLFVSVGLHDASKPAERRSSSASSALWASGVAHHRIVCSL